MQWGLRSHPAPPTPFLHPPEGWGGGGGWRMKPGRFIRGLCPAPPSSYPGDLSNQSPARTYQGALGSKGWGVLGRGGG